MLSEALSLQDGSWKEGEMSVSLGDNDEDSPYGCLPQKLDFVELLVCFMLSASRRFSLPLILSPVV